MADIPEHSLEINGHIGRLLALHAEDLRQDRKKGITGPYFQYRVEFHEALFDFVYADPQVERYKLVKIIETDVKEEEDGV